MWHRKYGSLKGLVIMDTITKKLLGWLGVGIVMIVALFLIIGTLSALETSLGWNSVGASYEGDQFARARQLGYTYKTEACPDMRGGREFRLVFESIASDGSGSRVVLGICGSKRHRTGYLGTRAGFYYESYVRRSFPEKVDFDHNDYFSFRSAEEEIYFDEDRYVWVFTESQEKTVMDLLGCLKESPSANPFVKVLGKGE